MARKAYIRKDGAGPGLEKYRVGVDEAGGTSVTPDVMRVQFFRDKYNALTAGEKTAFGNLTIAQLIGVAFDATTEV